MALKDGSVALKDEMVTCVDESDVLVNGPHRNGYIFLYLHKDLCSQVVDAEANSRA